MMYSGYGVGHHYGVGIGYSAYHPYTYFGKRSAGAEAKPEADPYLLYNGVGYHHGVGFGYSGYHHPYTTYFGKRSADAEPEPFVTYGAYGYGLHHGFGYSGFYHPYSTTYYGKRSAEAD